MMPTVICTNMTHAPDMAGLRELQLRVARRADELAQRSRGSQTADRGPWRRAEFEVFEQRGKTYPLRLDVARRPDGMKESETNA